MLQASIGMVPALTGLASIPLTCAAAQAYARIMDLDTMLGEVITRLGGLQDRYKRLREPQPIETYWRVTDGIGPQALAYLRTSADGKRARIYTSEGIDRFRRVAKRDFSQLGWVQMPSAAVEREVARANEVVNAYDAWIARGQEVSIRLGIPATEAERDHAKLGLDYDDSDVVRRVAHELVRLTRIAA
jgi:hypothetical protein